MPATRTMVVIGAGAALSLVIIWNTLTLAFSAVLPEQVLTFRNSLSVAQAVRSKGLLDAGDHRSANRYALGAISSSPVARDGLGLVVITLADQGKIRAARKAATALPINGNRDDVGNLMLLRFAAEDGNVPLMIERADAVLRSTILENVDVVIGLGTEAADPSFANRLAIKLASAPPWRYRFLHQLGGRPELAKGTWNILSALSKTKAPPTADEIAPYFWITGRTLEPGIARSQWDVFFAKAAKRNRHGVNDSGFDGKSGVAPFAWYLPTDETVATSLAPDGAGGSLLLVEFSGVKASFVTTQFMQFPPGNRQLSFRAASSESESKQGMTVYLSCIPSNASVVRQTVILQPEMQSHKVSLDIPGQACANQRLDFYAEPNFAQQAVQISLDDVRLSPAEHRAQATP